MHLIDFAFTDTRIYVLTRNRYVIFYQFLLMRTKSPKARKKVDMRLQQKLPHIESSNIGENSYVRNILLQIRPWTCSSNIKAGNDVTRYFRLPTVDLMSVSSKYDYAITTQPICEALTVHSLSTACSAILAPWR